MFDQNAVQAMVDRIRDIDVQVFNAYIKDDLARSRMPPSPEVFERFGQYAEELVTLNQRLEAMRTELLRMGGDKTNHPLYPLFLEIIPALAHSAQVLQVLKENGFTG